MRATNNLSKHSVQRNEKTEERIGKDCSDNGNQIGGR
jgi:hypothetical protein